MKKISISQIASAALAFAGLLGGVAALINADIWYGLFSVNELASEPGLVRATGLVWLFFPWLSIAAGAAGLIRKLKFPRWFLDFSGVTISIAWIATNAYRDGNQAGLDVYRKFFLFGIEMPGAFLIPVALLVALVFSAYSLLKSALFFGLPHGGLKGVLFGLAGAFGLVSYFEQFEAANQLFGMLFNENGDRALLDLFNVLIAPVSLLAFGILSLVPQVRMPAPISKFGPITLTTAALIGLFVRFETNRIGWESVATMTPDPLAPYGFLATVGIGLSIQSMSLFSILLIVILALHAIFSLSNPAPAASLKERMTGTRKFLSALVDSKLDNFISRKVSGVLYIIITWLTIWAVYLEVTYGLSIALMGNVGGVVLMIVMPVALIFALVLTRMVFEASVALIAVAENTKK